MIEPYLVKTQVHSAATVVRPLVVIPTRNRPDMALAAIKSVLQAGIPEVTVVVSDNSIEEPYVTELREAVEALGSASVTYIRPDRPMSMTHHWQWILEQVLAVPDWTHLVYLTDRHVFRDGALKLLMQIMREYDADVVSFNHDGVFDFTIPVLYHRAEWTGWVYTITSEHLLYLASEGVFGLALPRALNCFTSRAALEEMQSAFGCAFANVAPDYNFTFKLLCVLQTILYVDLPLIISHGFDRSNGFAHTIGVHNRASLDFQQNVPQGEALHTPFPQIETAGNSMFEEYLVVRDHPAGRRLPPVNQRLYVAALYREIAVLWNREVATYYRGVLSAAGHTRSTRAQWPFHLGIWFRVRRKFWYLLSGPSTRQFWAAIHRLTGIGVPFGGHFSFDSKEEAFRWLDLVPRGRTIDTRRADRLFGGRGGGRVKRVV